MADMSVRPALPPRRRARPLLALACLALAAACGRSQPDAAATASASAAADSSAAAAGAFRPLAVGDTVPTYATLTLAGDTARVAGAARTATLVNVWATWCTACREEMADLEALHREFAARGLTVLAVSVDEGDGRRVRRFVERERLTFAVAHDPEGRIQSLYGTVGVPETYLVGPDGRLVWRRAGNIHGALGEARQAIARTLGANVADAGTTR